jgi:phenylacetate-CoA ligase
LEDKLAVPIEEISDVCSTSGTVSGFTQPVLFTRKDFDASCIDSLVRGRWSAGVRPDDVVQSLFGLACHLISIRMLGATVLGTQAGRGNLDNQIKLSKSVGVTVLEFMPSMALHYFDRAKELGIDIRESKLRLVGVGGEPWAESYRKKIEAEYGIPFRSIIYGMSEGGELAAACEYGEGMHIFGDICIMEVIDPEMEQVLGPGEEGELVITNLVREAMPIIRYRTGDIAKILPYDEPCPCGRTHPRISTVKGRASQMIEVGGRKLLPIDVEEVLGGISGVGHEYQIVLDTPGKQERLRVRVEYTVSPDKVASLERRLKEALIEQLGIPAEVELVPVGSIGRALFKAMRIIKPRA